ncbi:MAG: glutamate-5-semialdehyde dehydrogenase [Spirochaetia bacterium]|nr:glutamate-5-semialdehyde dehydrogenase [Spirochaetia bacterium]
MVQENNFNLVHEEKIYIEKLAARAKQASVQLRDINTKQKNEALLRLADFIDDKKTEIVNENSQDIENAQINGLSQAMIDRLLLNDKVINSMIKSLHEIIALTDPVGSIIEGRNLPNGLNLKKIRIPIGVVAIIYESRPNVTIDVGALAVKSSNAVILRGGKEAILSNRILSLLFQKALSQAKLPADAVCFVEKPQRQLLYGLLQLKDDIDIIVPRGGEGLISFVAKHSLIPVVKHDKGVCHVYIHSSAKKEMAISVLINSKTHRPGVCNAAETLIIDKNWPHYKDALSALLDAGVKLYADKKTKEILSDFDIHDLTEEGYNKEYLSMDISVKIVENCSQAVQHIQTYTSQHSEAILAEDISAINEFEKKLDSAAIFINCSTRFHDGGQFGMGAEVGIATGKLHVRGPMGLSDLTTMKYVVSGEGQIRE